MTQFFRSFRDGIALERQRTMWRLLWTFTAVKLTFFVAVFALAWVVFARVAPGLFSGASAESLRSLVDGCVMALLMLQLADFNVGLLALGPYHMRAAPQSYARMLMNIAAARDMSLTTPIVIEPTADVASEPQTIGPLAHPMRSLVLSDGAYIAGALAGVFVMCMGIAMTVATFYTPPTYHPPAAVAWISWLSFPFTLLLIGFAGVLWALVARRFARMERQGFVAVVDSDGVIFRLAGRAGYEQRLCWSDVRALMRIMHTDAMGRVHEVFVLGGAETDVLWEAMYTTPGASTEETQREEAMRVAAHRLTEQVALRTGLPLLDITQTAYVALGAPPLPWSLFHRARAIARAQGDTAFASELTRHIGAETGLLAKLAVRMNRRLSDPRNLTPAQRDEILRLARAMLPYYPTPAQVTPNPRSRALTKIYWDSELALHLFILVVVFANSLSIFFLS